MRIRNGRDMTNPKRQSPIPQRWQAAQYARDGHFVSELAEDVFAWLAPQKGERILDLGCGDGRLTARIAASGAQVLGVDISEDLLAAARDRGLSVQRMDGEALSFDREFDAVFSNAALHWMTRPERVIAGVARALRPGGRFVAEFGGHGNVAAIITAMRAVARLKGGDETLAGPWFFPTPEHYAELLTQQGFQVERIGLFPRPTPLDRGLRAWLRLFRQPFFDQFPPEKRAEVLAEVESLLRPVLCDAAGNWTADYVRLRVCARLPK